MDWFLYDNGLRHERVKNNVIQCSTLTHLRTVNNVSLDRRYNRFLPEEIEFQRME